MCTGVVPPSNLWGRLLNCVPQSITPMRGEHAQSRSSINHTCGANYSIAFRSTRHSAAVGRLVSVPCAVGTWVDRGTASIASDHKLDMTPLTLRQKLSPIAEGRPPQGGGPWPRGCTIMYALSTPPQEAMGRIERDFFLEVLGRGGLTSHCIRKQSRILV